MKPPKTGLNRQFGMKDRIKKIMESMKMTQQDFSHRIGISTASLSNIFNGRTRPTMNIVEAIHNNMPEISIEWLLFGVEPMYVSGIKAQEAENELVGQAAPPTVKQEENLQQEERKTASAKPRNGVKEVEKPVTELKIVDTTRRHITEIRVYFDDQTYETFVPEKTS